MGSKPSESFKVLNYLLKSQLYFFFSKFKKKYFIGPSAIVIYNLYKLPMSTFQLNVNGKTQSIEADSDTPLLWVLRDHIDLVGT
ncbi:MAG: hypothetical protein ACI9AT_000818, partial [Ulvibacter sp.]